MIIVRLLALYYSTVHPFLISFFLISYLILALRNKIPKTRKKKKKRSHVTSSVTSPSVLSHMMR